MLFARGVLLVEGDAERFLLPVFAETIDVDLDQHGISICSVGGTHFDTYVKFLTSLGIPFAVLTDRDPKNSHALGLSRVKKLLSSIHSASLSETQQEWCSELEVDEARIELLAEENGMFLNSHTLEVDLFRGGFVSPIVSILLEAGFGQRVCTEIQEWEETPEQVEPRRLLALIRLVGKGRFAQQLAPILAGETPPDYISKAIKL